MTFNEICEMAQLTDAERLDAAWFLAAFRMRNTVEQLMKTKRPRGIHEAGEIKKMTREPIRPKKRTKSKSADVVLELSFAEYQTMLEGLGLIESEYGGTVSNKQLFEDAVALKARLLGSTESAHG